MTDSVPEKLGNYKIIEEVCSPAGSSRPEQRPPALALGASATGRWSQRPSHYGNRSGEREL